MTSFDQSIPGAPLEALLESLTEAELLRLVDEELISVWRQLNPDDNTLNAHFYQCLADHIDLYTLLSKPAIRSILLTKLPTSKQQELEERVGLTLDQLQGGVLETSYIQALAAFFGHTLDPSHTTEAPPATTSVNPHYPLFSHQRALATDILQHLEFARSITPRALMHMPTGAGKTRTAAHILSYHMAIRSNPCVVWVANSRELLQQAYDELVAAWKHLGNTPMTFTRYWGDHTSPNWNFPGVLIASLQKLHSLAKRDEEAIHALGNQATLLVVDEAHISLANTYHQLIKLLQRQPDCALLGLTATPGRTWNEPQMDKLLAEIYDYNKFTLPTSGTDSPVEALTQAGYLARPTFKRIWTREINEGDPPSVHSSTATSPTGSEEPDYDDPEPHVLSNAYLKAVVGAAQELVLSGHKRILVFTATVRHANNVSLLLRLNGYTASAITAETPLQQRQAAIRDFRNPTDTVIILVNHGVLTTGFDAPEASGAVIARPTKSLVLYSQMVGRVIRGPEAGGNRHADIITVVDPALPGFGSVAEAFSNWEDIW